VRRCGQLRDPVKYDVVPAKQAIQVRANTQEQFVREQKGRGTRAEFIEMLQDGNETATVRVC
jgi:hypothetical protein